MSPDVRKALVDIVAKFGDSILLSPGRCEGVLKDYCGEFRQEISVLVNCLRLGMVDELRQQNGPPTRQTCATLAMELEQNMAISPELASWALKSWALALGLLDPLGATATGKLARVSITKALPKVSKDDPGATGRLPSITAVAPVEPAAEETVAFDDAPSAFLAQEIEWRWGAPDWTNPAEVTVVHPDSSAQKPTLREALRGAEENARLILMPGVYKETLVIKKHIQFHSGGQQGEVILESPSSSVLVLDGACMVIAGITLRGVSGKEKKALPAVEVKSGHLVMEDCDLTSDSSSIVEVRGRESEVLLRRCQLHDGKAGGILFQDSATGYLEECDFFQNKLSHVAIGKGCSPTLFSCKISNALMTGIYINEGGGGLIENCDVWGNAVAGIQVLRGANPRVRHCRVSANGRYGIFVAEQSEGLFEECQFFDNARAGVTVGQRSKPRFSRCKIFDNHADGVEIIEQSQGEFVDCEIFSNEGANVVVKDKSTPSFARCRVHDGHQEGVRMTAGAEGLYDECEIFSNGKAGLLATNAKPVFQNSRFFNGMDSGIVVQEETEGKFTDCEITRHGATAVIVGGKGQSRFERCDISHNQTNGVYTSNGSAPTFLACTINHNTGIGFSNAETGSPRMTEGEISENAGGGVLVSSQGKGRWEKVRMIGNRCDAVIVAEGGRPTFRQCEIETTEGVGIRFRNQGGGSIEESTIVESGGPGIEIEAGASPSLRQVRVLKGKAAGIVVHALGIGSADKCEASDNLGGDWKIDPKARLTRTG